MPFLKQLLLIIKFKVPSSKFQVFSFSEFLGNIIVDVLAAFGGEFLSRNKETVPLRLRQSTVDVLAGDSILD